MCEEFPFPLLLTELFIKFQCAQVGWVVYPNTSLPSKSRFSLRMVLLIYADQTPDIPVMEC